MPAAARTSCSSNSAALALAGVYSFIWRYVGLGEVKAFIYAAIVVGAVLAVLRLSLPDALRTLARPAVRHRSWARSSRSAASSGCVSLRRYLYERSQRKKRSPRPVGAESSRRC